MREKWERLSDRDRQTLILGAIALFFIMGYYFFYHPLIVNIQQLKTQIGEERALLIWLEPASKQIETLRKEKAANTTPTQDSLLAVIEQSLKTDKLEALASEISQTERNKVRIKMDMVPFDAIVDWLTQLWKKQAIEVIQFSAKPTGTPGNIQLVVILSKAEQ